MPIFPGQKVHLRLFKRFWQVCWVMIIAISVQRSYWWKSLHHPAAVSKRLISSDTWFKSIGQGTTVHFCNLLILCFFISCHKRNTQKKVYRFVVDRNSGNNRDFAVLFFHQDNVDSTIFSAASIGWSESQYIAWFIHLWILRVHPHHFRRFPCFLRFIQL